MLKDHTLRHVFGLLLLPPGCTRCVPGAVTDPFPVERTHLLRGGTHRSCSIPATLRGCCLPGQCHVHPVLCREKLCQPRPCLRQTMVGLQTGYCSKPVPVAR